MINLFTLNKGRLYQQSYQEYCARHLAYQEAATQGVAAAVPPMQAIWIDLIDPTEEEIHLIESDFKIELPRLQDLGDLEASARFFETENALHLRNDFLIDEAKVRNIPVAFVLANDILFSMHTEDLPVFRLVRMRAHTKPGTVNSAKDVLIDLYATDIEHSADAIEEMYKRLEIIGKRVLERTSLPDADAAIILKSVAYEEDINGHIRCNIMDTRRALSFLMRHKLLDAEQQNDAYQILGDIESIENHSAYLFDKLNFILAAVSGFVNVNQNKITKIFSVASVALMPPTLVASIYGMNFSLPEFKWGVGKYLFGHEFSFGIFGYFWVICLMVLSALAPLLWFKKKGWLD
jgi:magnesium transporter